MYTVCLFVLFMGFSRQEYWSGLPVPVVSPVDHVLSSYPSWVALHSMTHSFIELDKAVVYVISNTEEAEVEWFYEDLQDLLELTPKKDVFFIIGKWNENVGSQEIPGILSKFGLRLQNEAEFSQENTLVIANTLFKQHKRRLYTWTSPGGQYQNQIDYILFSQRWRNSIQSAKTRRSWLWLRSWTPYGKIQT